MPELSMATVFTCRLLNQPTSSCSRGVVVPKLRSCLPSGTMAQAVKLGLMHVQTAAALVHHAHRHHLQHRVPGGGWSRVRDVNPRAPVQGLGDSKGCLTTGRPKLRVGLSAPKEHGPSPTAKIFHAQGRLASRTWRS